MFKRESLLFGFVVAAWSCTALAGVGSSGGGISVVCRDHLGGVQRVEVLDLYEGRARYGLRYPAASGELEQDYLRGVKNTYHLQGVDDYPIGSEAAENLQRFLGVVQFTAPGEHLPRLNDEGAVPSLPFRCSLEQVAIFETDALTGKESVRVDSELWAAMDSLNQAALVTHELWYKLERELEETTSEGTRAAVAHLYASAGATPIREGLPEDRFECTTGGMNGYSETRTDLSFFWVHGKNVPGRGPEVTLQFFQLMGRPIVSKAIAELPGISFLLTNYPDGPAERKLIPVVAEAGADRVFRVPVQGSQRKDLELGVEYIQGRPLKLSVFQKGVLIQTAVITHCFK
ncbi:MAG: hypothetical protein NDJ90_03080 [Oligoflexia bacterium]|nr:hypothetical protein [Oligoflexia bacterium]